MTSALLLVAAVARALVAGAIAAVVITAAISLVAMTLEMRRLTAAVGVEQSQQTTQVFGSPARVSKPRCEITGPRSEADEWPMLPVDAEVGDKCFCDACVNEDDAERVAITSGAFYSQATSKSQRW